MQQRLRTEVLFGWRVIHMGERKLESITGIDNTYTFDGYPLQGFSLKFVSGPEMTKAVKPGSWLNTWETVDGKRRFNFGPRKTVVFATEQAAIDAQTELKKAVDVVTEVAE
jgi:hypothetical protein